MGKTNARGNENLTDKPRDGMRRTRTCPNGEWGADRQLCAGIGMPLDLAPKDRCEVVQQGRDRVVTAFLPQTDDLVMD
jgi:hypothetical protein